MTQDKNSEDEHFSEIKKTGTKKNDVEKSDDLIVRIVTEAVEEAAERLKEKIVKIAAEKAIEAALETAKKITGATKKKDVVVFEDHQKVDSYCKSNVEKVQEAVGEPDQDTGDAVPDSTLGSCEAVKPYGVQLDFNMTQDKNSEDEHFSEIKKTGTKKNDVEKSDDLIVRIVTEAVEEAAERLKEKIVKIAAEKAIEAALETAKKITGATKKKDVVVFEDHQKVDSYCKSNVEKVQEAVGEPDQDTGDAVPDSTLGSCEAVKPYAEPKEDPICSKGTFRFTVPFLPNFDSWLSPSFIVRGLPWYISLQLAEIQKGYQERYENVSKVKNLAFYLILEAEEENQPSRWWCYAKAQLRLLPHTTNNQPYYRKIKHLFRSDSYDAAMSGFDEFISWADLLNPAAGFIKDNAITVEVYLKTEPIQTLPYPPADDGDH